MISSFVTFLRSFSQWCHNFGTLVVLPLVTVIITLDVAMRYLFNSPLQWGEEIYGLMLFLILMLSMTYAWDMHKHIRMELAYVRFGPRWRVVSDIVTGLTGMTFFGLLGVQSVRDIVYMINTNETTDILKVPLWPFRAVLALICLVFVMKLVHYVFAGRKEGGGDEIERDGIVIPREQH